MRSRDCAKASRAQGIGARLKYIASPRASSTTLTTFGLKASATSAIGWQAVAIAASVRSQSVCAMARISAGSSSGSSPWTLTTIASSARPSCAAASASRSVPVGWSLRVMQTAMPCAATAARTRSSSVATATRAAPAARARSATRTTIGLPAMSASGLPGSREDA